MLYFIALYAALNDPEWDRRETASSAILRLVDRHPAIYGPRLERLACEATEPEIRSRVRVPLACFYRWRANSFVPTTCPVWPQCDMTPDADGRRNRDLGRPWLTIRPGDSQAPYWHGYRRGTERMVRSMIADGASPLEADDLLRRMWEIEQAENGDCPNPGVWDVSKNWKTWQGGYPKPQQEMP